MQEAQRSPLFKLGYYTTRARSLAWRCIKAETRAWDLARCGIVRARDTLLRL